jgi:hypothetical protein
MRKMKVVWGSAERRGRAFWSRIGLAWETPSGTLYAKLAAVPLNGRICITTGAEEPPAEEVAALLTGEAVQ